ncbi:MAG: hypothetical protein JNM31_07085 [Flavobacteriales bacterium]|nr:hypothetical protein [Flavobacteriales bacterium]
MRPAVLVMLALSTLPIRIVAQEGGRTQKQQEKILAKQEKQKKKDAQAAEKEMKARHSKIQDKQTRKRLKRQNKRADRHGSNTHRDPFFRRLFMRKH